LIVKIK